MTSRKLLPYLFALLIAGAYLALPSIAQARAIHLAQEGQGTDNENAGGGEEGSGEGQSDPEAETGVEEGQTEEVVEEEGPPWTYQMARISIVLILFFGGGVGLLYYKLIASRQKGTV